MTYKSCYNCFSKVTVDFDDFISLSSLYGMASWEEKSNTRESVSSWYPAPWPNFIWKADETLSLMFDVSLMNLKPLYHFRLAVFTWLWLVLWSACASCSLLMTWFSVLLHWALPLLLSSSWPSMWVCLSYCSLFPFITDSNFKILKWFPLNVRAISAKVTKDGITHSAVTFSIQLRRSYQCYSSQADSAREKGICSCPYSNEADASCQFKTKWRPFLALFYEAWR